MCQEVQRRLGPDSMVTKQMYKSFVAEVLHKTVVNKAPVCLREFVWGQVVSMLVLPGSLEIFRKLLKLFFFRSEWANGFVLQIRVESVGL